MKALTTSHLEEKNHIPLIKLANVKVTMYLTWSAHSIPCIWQLRKGGWKILPLYEAMCIPSVSKIIEMNPSEKAASSDSPQWFTQPIASG